jgi:hypothetical protein
MSLAWVPDDRRLVIGCTEEGPASGIQILDTTRSIRAGNPRTVGPYTVPNLPRGQYTDPALLPDETVTAISPRCWGGMICPPDTNVGDAVVTVEASTARVRRTLLSAVADPGIQLSDLAVDPSGQRLAVEGMGTSGPVVLYTISGGRLHALTNSVGAFGWLPRPVPKTQAPAKSATAKSGRSSSNSQQGRAN